MQPAQSGPGNIDFDWLKQGMRGAWMAGDFGQIARLSSPAAEAFVDRLRIQPGARVLDVACGTENLAIPAAPNNCPIPMPTSML
jgi:2-polyprenyl-3-methyl-5-hydroxy-6-metoxy-1,4-benzoquinol methylase